MNYTYIVKCSDGSLYTGWTNNLEKRIKDHNAGRGAKYTKARRPVVLVYKEEFPTKQEAMKREWEYNRLHTYMNHRAVIRFHFFKEYIFSLHNSAAYNEYMRIDNMSDSAEHHCKIICHVIYNFESLLVS